MDTDLIMWIDIITHFSNHLLNHLFLFVADVHVIRLALNNSNNSSLNQFEP